MAQKFSFADVKSRGAPLSPQTPPHSLRRVTVARPPLGRVPLSSMSLSVPLTSSSGAAPRGYTRCAGRGTCWIFDLPHRGGAAVVPAVASRSKTAIRLAMQVSARPRTTIIMVHPGRRRPWLASGCTCEEQAERPSPRLLEPAQTTHCSGPLMGTVALFRMGKRVPVVEHHFCQHGAPRCVRGAAMGAVRPCSGPCTAP